MLVSANPRGCYRLEMPALPVPWAPADISPFGASGEAGLALVALIMMARHTSSTTSGNFEKNKVYYSQVLEGIFLSQAAVRLWVERNKESVDLGLCLYWGRGWGSGVSQVHPLGSENVGEKSRVTRMISYLGEPALSKRGTSWVGHFGSLSSCVVSNVFIGDGCLWSGKASWPHLQYNQKADCQTLTLCTPTPLPSTIPQPWPPLICSPVL